METLRGSHALSVFRININKLLVCCQDARLQVDDIYAEYIHFTDVSAVLDEDVLSRFQWLLKYGHSLAEHQSQGRLLLVTQRPDARLSWSSKATDIAHNGGLSQVTRLERVSGLLCSGAAVK